MTGKKPWRWLEKCCSRNLTTLKLYICQVCPCVALVATPGRSSTLVSTLARSIALVAAPGRSSALVATPGRSSALIATPGHSSALLATSGQSSALVSYSYAHVASSASHYTPANNISDNLSDNLDILLPIHCLTRLRSTWRDVCMLSLWLCTRPFWTMYLCLGIYLLTRDGNNAKAAAKLRALVQAAFKQEPHNPALWLRLSLPFTRLAGEPHSSGNVVLCC